MDPLWRPGAARGERLFRDGCSSRTCALLRAYEGQGRDDHGPHREDKKRLRQEDIDASVETRYPLNQPRKSHNTAPVPQADANRVRITIDEQGPRRNIQSLDQPRSSGNMPSQPAGFG